MKSKLWDVAGRTDSANADRLAAEMKGKVIRYNGSWWRPAGMVWVKADHHELVRFARVVGEKLFEEITDNPLMTSNSDITRFAQRSNSLSGLNAMIYLACGIPELQATDNQIRSMSK